MSQISVIRNSHPIIQLYSCQTSFAQWNLKDFHLFRQVDQLISCCRTPDLFKTFFPLYSQILENKVDQKYERGPSHFNLIIIIIIYDLAHFIL